MVDVLLLAGGLARLLSPLVPYLLRAARRTQKSAADELGARLGADASEQVQLLWRKLWPRLRARQDGRQAVERLAADPGQGGQAALAGALRELLAGDPRLAEELDQRLRRIEVSVSGERAVGAGTIAGSTVVTGDDNVVQTGGKYQIQIGQAGKVWIGDRDER